MIKIKFSREDFDSFLTLYFVYNDDDNLRYTSRRLQ